MENNNVNVGTPGHQDHGKPVEYIDFGILAGDYDGDSNVHSARNAKSCMTSSCRTVNAYRHSCIDINPHVDYGVSKKKLTLKRRRKQIAKQSKRRNRR